MNERLQKILARAGIASRRKAEEMIRAGRVQVNGLVVTEMGRRADPAADRIAVDGRVIAQPEPFVYLVLHKPQGVLSTTRDDRGRRIVLDLIPAQERIYPVGRLDAGSEGLLLLTNDGELAHRLTHPRYEHEKEYHVLVQGCPTPETLERLRKGVSLEDGPARVDAVELLSEGKESWLRIIVHEGRKHLVRRLCAAVGHPVQRLIRVRIGPLTLGNLPTGRHRHLTDDEIKQLKGMKIDR